MNKKPLRSRDIFAAIAISLLILIPAISHALLLLPISKAVASNGGIMIGYCMMFVLVRYVAGVSGVLFSSVIGKPPVALFFPIAIAHAVLQLSFTFGENFVEVYLAAQHAPEFAYKYWNFHSEPYVLQMTAWGYVTLAVAQFAIAPFVEEYVFRGLLLKVWSGRWGISKAILVNAALFAVLHLNRHYFFSTFIFGLTMCLLYVRYQSLWINALAHAAFNLMAFVCQYMFNFHWLKSLDDLGRLSSWIPQMGMLLVSAPVLTIFIIKNWPVDGSSKGGLQVKTYSAA